MSIKEKEKEKKILETSRYLSPLLCSFSQASWFVSGGDSSGDGGGDSSDDGGGGDAFYKLNFLWLKGRLRYQKSRPDTHQLIGTVQTVHSSSEIRLLFLSHTLKLSDKPE